PADARGVYPPTACADCDRFSAADGRRPRNRPRNLNVWRRIGLAVETLPMTDARERLSRLIELAGENTPEKQRALAFELCDLLIDWPQRYPPAMREPFEALLEKVLRRLDGATRRMIAARLAGHPETALALLNEFYFDVPADARTDILRRNAELNEPATAP